MLVIELVLFIQELQVMQGLQDMQFTLESLVIQDCVRQTKYKMYFGQRSAEMKSIMMEQIYCIIVQILLI